MTCQELSRLPLDDFVDGRLDAEGQAAVVAHLRVCSECATLVEALSEARDILLQTEPIAVSPQFEQQLGMRLRQHDLTREGIRLLALGVAAVATLLRLLLAQRGNGGTSAASAPPD